MASAVVVLKYETSYLRQSNNFIKSDFKFGVGDYVREVTGPAKVDSWPISGRDDTWGSTYTGTVTFFVFVLLFLNRATAHTREPIFTHNSSKNAVSCIRKTLFGMRNV